MTDSMKEALEKIKAIAHNSGDALLEYIAVEALEKGKYQVCLDVPELTDNGLCNMFCPARQGLISGKADCKSGYMKNQITPGFLCPRYIKGEEGNERFNSDIKKTIL
jgi:hypothetical protein